MFASLNQIGKQVIKMLRVFAQGFRKAGACSHLIHHVFDQMTHAWTLHALGHDAKCLKYRYASTDHGRHLAGEHGDILATDLLAAAKQGGLLAQALDYDSLADQRVLDLIDVGRHQLAFDVFTARVLARPLPSFNARFFLVFLGSSGSCHVSYRSLINGEQALKVEP